MTKSILLFSVAEEKAAIIDNICKNKGWQKMEIDKSRYNDTLGEILEINLDTPNSKRADVQFSDMYMKIGFPVEMIVFGGFNGKDIEEFLEAYKAYKVEPVPLKAMVTPYNVEWTIADLFAELMEEHRRLGNV